MNAETKRTPGHVLEAYTSGPNDAYWRGACICGRWHFKGWTTRKRDVRDAHKGHVARERAAIAKAEGKEIEQ